MDSPLCGLCPHLGDLSELWCQRQGRVSAKRRGQRVEPIVLVKMSELTQVKHLERCLFSHCQLFCFFFSSEILASPSPLQLLFSSRQWTIIYCPEGTSSIFSTCSHFLCYNVNFGCVEICWKLHPEIPICIFSWSESHGLWYHNWASLLGFHSSAAFSSVIPSPSSLSASWLFAWIAKKKDKYFQLMYFESWSSLFKCFQDAVFYSH